LGIPAYGVCSLDGIGAATDGATLVATDARRREVYWAVYHDGVRVAGPAVGRPDDLAEALGEVTVDVAVGDGALRYADALPWPVRPEPRYPDPAVLARLAAPRIAAGSPGEALTPLYLRRPDAVEPAGPKPVTR
jgi:tRNA threonylcarbamoyl adenosine modification protein YeaZ